MKRLIALVSALLFLWILTGTAAAASYTDSFYHTTSGAECRYDNLTAVRDSGATASHPSGRYAQIKNPGQLPGRAQYQMTGATLVQVELASYFGTQVTLRDGQLVLGAPSRVGGTPTTWSAVFDSATHQVYTGAQERWYQAVYSPEEELYLFEETDDRPTSGQPYGLALYAKSESGSWRPVPCWRDTTPSGQPEGWVLENWVATVAPTDRYLRVEINDIPVWQTGEGGTVVRSPSQMTRLASVRIEGRWLEMGVPGRPQSEKEITTPPVELDPWADSYAMPKAPEKEGSTTEKTKAPTSSYNEGSLEESAADSGAALKFEGQLPLPSKSTKKTSARKTQSKTAAGSTIKKETTAVQVDQAPEETSEETTVYYVEAGASAPDEFQRLTSLYILVATGVMVLVLLAPKGSK